MSSARSGLPRSHDYKDKSAKISNRVGSYQIDSKHVVFRSKGLCLNLGFQLKGVKISSYRTQNFQALVEKSVLYAKLVSCARPNTSQKWMQTYAASCRFKRYPQNPVVVYDGKQTFPFDDSRT